LEVSSSGNNPIECIHYTRALTATMSSSSDESSVVSSNSSGSHEYGGSNGTTNSTAGGQSCSSVSGDQKERFVQKESRHVSYLRVWVVLILLLAAAAVTTLVFIITRDSELEECWSHFEAAGEKILGKRASHRRDESHNF